MLLSRPLIVYLIYLMVASSSLSAQGWLVTPEAIYGKPLRVEAFLKGENKRGRRLRRFDGLGFTVERRPRVNREWHERYGRPATGIGIRSFHLDSPQELGNPTAVYRSFRGPFFRRNSFSFDYTSALGLAAGMRRFDHLDNPFNTLMSTRLVAYVQLGLGARQQIGERFTLAGDVSLHHFSNGNIKKPNTGLNAVAATLGVYYHAGREAEIGSNRPAVYFQKHQVVNLSIYGGVERLIHWTEGLPLSEILQGLSHPVAGLNLSVERQLSKKSGIGLGASLVYRSSTPVRVTGRDNKLVRVDPLFTAKNIRVGIFPTYVQTFGRVSVVVQAEYYLYRYRTEQKMRRFTQKLGFRYGLTERLYAGAFVAARDFTIAEYVEWRVGYRLFTGDR